MAVKLVDKRIMVTDGIYLCRQISTEQFINEVVDACENSNLDSYIQIRATAEMITRETGGVTIPISRMQATLNDGDTMLVAEITRNSGRELSDFSFFLARYWSHFTP